MSLALTVLPYQGHVIGQLQFTVMPTNVTVEVGMDTTLPCVATGALEGSIIIYDWFLDNLTNPLAISNNSSERVYITDGNLTFSEVIDEDEAVYICMAVDSHNSSSRVISDPVYLTGMSVVILIHCDHYNVL